MFVGLIYPKRGDEAHLKFGMFCSKYRVLINGFWITIYNTEDEVLFKRDPKDGNWLDAAHKSLINPIEELEKAVMDLMRQVEKERQ